MAKMKKRKPKGKPKWKTTAILLLLAGAAGAATLKRQVIEELLEIRESDGKLTWHASKDVVAHALLAEIQTREQALTQQGAQLRACTAAFEPYRADAEAKEAAKAAKLAYELSVKAEEARQADSKVKADAASKELKERSAAALEKEAKEAKEKEAKP